MKKGSRSYWVKTYVKGEKILDIGFVGDSKGQNPWFLHQIIREHNPNSVIIGLDIDKYSIKRYIKLEKACNDIILANGLQLPFRDQYFDIVFMGEVVEHVWDPVLLLRETFRVLKTKGKLCITTPNQFHLVNVVNFWFKRKSEVDPDHKIIFDLRSLSNLLTHTGFKMIQEKTLKVVIPFLNKNLTLEVSPFSRMGATLCVIAKKIDLQNYNDKI